MGEVEIPTAPGFDRLVHGPNGRDRGIGCDWAPSRFPRRCHGCCNSSWSDRICSGGGVGWGLIAGRGAHTSPPPPASPPPSRTPTPATSPPCLDWHTYHFSPELCNMDLKKLLILDLSGSRVTEYSQIWSQIMKKAKELKVLNLQGCNLLRASLESSAPSSESSESSAPSSESSAPTDLEILIMEDCNCSLKLRALISKLESLKSLNLRKCKGVQQLVQGLRGKKLLKELLIDGTDIEEIHIENDSLKDLEVLSARDCKKLKDISPIGHLTKLKSLALGGAIIDWVPETFDFPPNLERLSLRHCKKLCELPPSIGKLKQLEEMDLSETGITQLPESVKDLSNLKMLKMERTPLQKFPKDIVKLEKLEEIDFSGCTNLEAQEDSCDISGLSSLRILRLSSSFVVGLPQGICGLPLLRTLDVRKCERLQALPELPSSLVTLCWGSKIMADPILTNLTNLKELCLNVDEQLEAGSSNQTPNIWWIMGLTRLETLELSLPNVTNLPGSFRGLTKLRELTLSYMKELDLTQLPSSNLWTLRLKHCKIPELKFSSLKHLSELELEDCDLAQIDGLEDLKLLEVLKVFHCNRIINLNGLRDLRRLRKVQVYPFDADRLSELCERGCEVDTCLPPSSRSVAG
ncbi:hypothetical protein EUGRSUZ_C02631 [Eucalyptus grandis]|uniref:Uncharacterized protein n=2 Tax=Eucalyptus grandis TaxID=71139 RepID=A0ACC3LGS4_EUCGR|nr:hypothetical protein EUGRSUZ_C02631 [Eucalyptus grandis]